MEPIYLSELASRKTAWLAARQQTLAANIANVNTPGYRAKDVTSFGDVLARTHLDLASTSVGHLPITGAGEAGGAGMREDVQTVDVTESGNSVGVEQQMIKTNEVNRDYAMTTNIVKSFHAMLMASLRE